MKIERIKKNHKKEIIIGGLITICLISAITITTSKAKYKLTEDIELAKGTINYKPYDFKVMAMYQSDDGTNYNKINEMPGKNYKINEEKSYCTINNVDKDSKSKVYTNKYGEHIIEKLQQTEKCYIYFDKNTEIVSTILGNIEVNKHTPDFSQTATTDEGIFKSNDNDGVSYYWRGAATTNYLKFANYCWRIVRINGDKTIRLIYDGTVCHQNGEATTDSIAVQNVPYNIENGHSEYVGWTYVEGKQRPEEGDTAINSNDKVQTEEWYNNYIENNLIYASKVARGKFCNDRDVQSGNSWSTTGSKFYYTGYNRIYTDYQPTLSCNLDDIYTLNVGLITADEMEFAGGTNENNTLYYLNNGQGYWTMSPEEWNNGSSSARMFVMFDSGWIAAWTGVNNASGLRPAINLKSDITISGGNGTIDNPYIVQ